MDCSEGKEVEIETALQHLINQVMDEVSFENGGTEIRMPKR